MIKSLKYLQIKLAQKNIISITGNVNDIYTYFNEDNEFISVDIKNIIENFARNNNYSKAEYFSPGYKLLNLLDQDNDNNYKRIDDVDNIDEFMSRVLNNIDDANLEYEHTPGIWVIDFADSIFNNQNNQNNYLDNLINLISIFLNNNNKKHYLDDHGRLEKQDKLILIMRDSHNLIFDIYHKNIEYAEVLIKKPNIDERKNIIKNLSKFFRTADVNELGVEGAILNNASALTDGLSCKEIIQFARIKDNKQTFSNRYNLTTFNQKESQWEKINYEKIKNLKNEFIKRVKGQNYAIDKIYNILTSSFLGLNGLLYSQSKNKPKGILFFVGPTGTGKTEISKTLAEFVFGNEKKLIRFDMSEYNHEHSDQRLIGAPPGYVGYDSGGELTNKVKENPFSILLFDEIEKAHSKILDKFLQILEDGRLTSSKGELIDFSESFIIFTSNIGTNKIDADFADEPLVRSQFIEHVRNHFIEKINRPELLNRIGNKNIVPFNFIHNREIIKTIIHSKLKVLFGEIEDKYNLIIDYNNDLNELVDYIVKIMDKRMGARGIINNIDELLSSKINQFLFDNYEKIVASKNEKNILQAKMTMFRSEVEFSFK
ncbi:ATP-dependent Clp protease ATP-binding subunit [Mycoplasmopsis phocirhinis]|uniref:ATP-dependent Clp protease ATP-binding subunit n=1 Tax=Mycoplasmopsis phocirhinis TaxID=142650 RepID=A0A4P6MPZ5_9BACT|nr:AAA family ATPase [Mycoplasmopsis phocirhinis]QBF34826.1 ATP-dependent Clp protease ATP-binding subunit [Mycoplasmopsis phocirhinis]